MTNLVRRLIVMRHGKAGFDDEDDRDFIRRLTVRGESQAALMASWLHRESILPDVIFSSTAVRAFQTVMIAARGLNFAPEAIEFRREMYLADVGTLMSVIRSAPAVKTVMLMGHNPGLEALICELCGSTAGRREDHKLMTTAAAAVVDMPEDWSGPLAGMGQLAVVKRPADLR